MRSGDILNAKLRTKAWLFDAMIIETHYLESFLTLLGRVVTYHMN